ncbi:hypothetical protein Hamer_G023119 [Homarus americanus]|uniref:Uncharacterized protein n=1 Tax=Homarus americanus TaxID=6706 RepID=A0A8J5K0U9_HOMAM|nr:hypothetical protein Hamer_G023119 [Homarus americanus]
METSQQERKEDGVFTADENTRTPYRSQPFATKFKFQLYEPVQPSEHKDLPWVLICMHNIATPVWRSWNSLTTVDPLPIQKIGYMKNIKFPHAKLDVARHTMLQSQKVCGEKYINVAYDLAISKLPMRIQEEEA